MLIFKKEKYYIFIGVFFILNYGCKKDPITEYTYENKPVSLYTSGAEKNKLKTNEQYVSVLYTNLFQKALSGNDIYNISNVFQSIGDQEIAREVFISNLMNKSGVIIPSNDIMRADIDAFIVETYKRFLLRYPTEGEKAYFRTFISSDPNVTVEMVYFSFALSNEYLFY